MGLSSAMSSILRELLEPSKSGMYLLHLPQLVMGIDLIATKGEIFPFEYWRYNINAFNALKLLSLDE